ncbi:hypothetical protein V5799_011036, partial [Amblyomma americanum]
MEDLKPPVRMDFMPTDTSVRLAGRMEDKATEIRQQPEMQRRRPSQAIIWLSLLAIGLIITGPAVTFWLLRRGEK